MPRRIATIFLILPLAMFSLSCAASSGAKSAACGCCQESASTRPALKDSIYPLNASWQADDGSTLTLEHFRSHPVVIAMFFASCEGTCVLTVEHLRELDASLPAKTREQTRFVLVTFDPTHDSARVLSAYRADQHLPAGRWTLLRGTPETTAQLASRLGIDYSVSSFGRIVHTNQMTVLDADGRIVSQQFGSHPDMTLTLNALAQLETR